MQEPPHVHASGHGGKAKVWLNPIEMAQQQGFKTSDINRILEVVAEHRNEILEAWNEFFRSIS